MAFLSKIRVPRVLIETIGSPEEFRQGKCTHSPPVGRLSGLLLPEYIRLLPSLFNFRWPIETLIPAFVIAPFKKRIKPLLLGITLNEVSVTLLNGVIRICFVVELYSNSA